MSGYKITFKIYRGVTIIVTEKVYKLTLRDYTEGFWINEDYDIKPPAGTEYMYIMPHQILAIEKIGGEW